MTTNPYASLCRKYPYMCKFLAPFHQTNSSMQTCPSGTTYKYHFPNTLRNCRSLPRGTPRAGSASILNAHNKDWLKELAKEIPEAKWEIQNIHNHPYQTALGSGQHSGLNKFNLISYPMTTLKPQKAKIKQVPC